MGSKGASLGESTCAHASTRHSQQVWIAEQPSVRQARNQYAAAVHAPVRMQAVLSMSGTRPSGQAVLSKDVAQSKMSGKKERRHTNTNKSTTKAVLQPKIHYYDTWKRTKKLERAGASLSSSTRARWAQCTRATHQLVAVPPGEMLLPLHAAHVPFTTMVPPGQVVGTTHAVLLAFAIWPVGQAVQLLTVPPGEVVLPAHGAQVALTAKLPVGQLFGLTHVALRELGTVLAVQVVHAAPGPPGETWFAPHEEHWPSAFIPDPRMHVWGGALSA